MSLLTIAQELVDQTQQIEKSRSDRAETKNIDDTYQKIVALQQKLDTLTDQVTVLRENDVVPLSQEFIGHLEIAKQKLIDAQQAFQSVRRQVSSISEVQTCIERAEDELKKVWSAYTAKRINPIRTTLELIRGLPDVHNKLNEHHEVLHVIGDFEKRLPRNSADWFKFTQAIARYQLIFDSVEGLDPEIIEFLKKVRNRDATLADLTENILTWCYEGNRLQTFTIQLGNV